MNKVKLATVWLDGCSGCHMSFLDMDERLFSLADRVDLVYSPLVDVKEFPERVDVTLVEGAVSNEEDREKIKKIRARTKILVSLGDCAVTSNVPSLRNTVGLTPLMEKVYPGTTFGKEIPGLLPSARPVHEFVKVDLFIPGCPPSAETIFHALTDLLDGRTPDLATKVRFGS